MKKFFLLVLLIVLSVICLPVFSQGRGEGGSVRSDEWYTSTDGESESGAEDGSPYVPERIFGVDNRFKVKNPSYYPYSAIAYMDVSARCGCNWTCSGFMVGQDTMLTAAHCLVCTKHSSWAKNINFYFGYKNAYDYSYLYNGAWTAWAGNIFSNREYTVNNDYGCIKLRENVGNIVGWFGTRWDYSDSYIKSKYLYVAGYRNGTLRYDSGWVTPSGDFLTYQMDTVKGNSGGPIYGSDYYVVGINIAENGSYNTGYRLSNTVISELRNLR